MRHVCIFHAGCPDGFGAAWSAWLAWGERGAYVARGHDDALRAPELAGDYVLFADIAPPTRAYRPLANQVAHLVVLDHHVSAQRAFAADPFLARELADAGHEVRFDLTRSGAALAWSALHPDEALPDLLAYVEDQDLWRWKLPRTHEINAAIGSYPRDFTTWSALASASLDALAEQGAPILRAQRIEVERTLAKTQPLAIAGLRVEGVNARTGRAEIGHELATRARYGSACGAVYRIEGRRVDVSLYSIGELDVAAIATALGGGGHKNAAGFSVDLAEWLARFVC
jgi:oligoribonuclease NrnB/cAMP/cGMP phosphodiesterase (DHH superfamily)